MSKKPNPLAYALYLLGRRGRTEYELREKLAEKGHEPGVVEATIKELAVMNLLDDKTFAELYARDKVGIYRRGKYRIGLELLRKGVKKELIDDALERVEEADELAAARSLAEGRLRVWKDLEALKRRQRLFGLLGRRGFSPKIVRQILGELK